MLIVIDLVGDDGTQDEKKDVTEEQRLALEEQARKEAYWEYLQRIAPQPQIVPVEGDK